MHKYDPAIPPNYYYSFCEKLAELPTPRISFAAAAMSAAVAFFEGMETNLTGAQGHEMRKSAAAQLATDEGLSLVPSRLTGTGYEGVVRLPQSESKPDQEGCKYQAHIREAGQERYLGIFHSAYEASLACARALGPERCAQAAAEAAAEASRQASSPPAELLQHSRMAGA